MSRATEIPDTGGGRVARFLAAALALTANLWLAAAAGAGPPKPATNDFLLRAPAEESEAIADRNGLEIVRVVEVSGVAVYYSAAGST